MMLGADRCLHEGKAGGCAGECAGILFGKPFEIHPENKTQPNDRVLNSKNIYINQKISFIPH